MLKPRRKRKSLRMKPPQQQVATAADDLAAEKAIALRLVKIFRFMNILALVFAVVSFFNLHAIEKAMGWLFYIDYWILIILSATGVLLQKKVAPRSDVMTQILIDPTVFRRMSTTFLALLVFQNVVAAMPLLYIYGYVTLAADWIQSVIPGKITISSNISIGASFVIAAVVSGVLGNLAYDILKHFVMKRLQRKG